MKAMDRKKITDEIISKIKSVPVGVDWRIIRTKQKSIRVKNTLSCKEQVSNY